MPASKLISATALFAAVCLVVLAVSGASADTSSADLLARPHGRPDARLAYGPGPQEFGELWLPAGRGPFPVAVLIHGGCWRGDLPGLELMTPMAVDLRRRGYAVWNIEYTRLGQPGGGWPRTFTDVTDAIAFLRRAPQASRLDLSRIVLIGHSAGGHLALWAAKSTHPRGVVSLAGIGDLEQFARSGPGVCGEPGTVQALMRGATLAQTSPAAMLPLGPPLVVVSGTNDTIVPPAFADAFTAAARRKGDMVRGYKAGKAGHFDLIDPRSKAWQRIVLLIQSASRKK